MVAPLSERINMRLARGHTHTHTVPRDAAWKTVVAMVGGALLAGAILYGLLQAALTLKTLTAPT